MFSRRFSPSELLLAVLVACIVCVVPLADASRSSKKRTAPLSGASATSEPAEEPTKIPVLYSFDGSTWQTKGMLSVVDGSRGYGRDVTFYQDFSAWPNDVLDADRIYIRAGSSALISFPACVLPASGFKESYAVTLSPDGTDVVSLQHLTPLSPSFQHALCMPGAASPKGRGDGKTKGRSGATARRHKTHFSVEQVASFNDVFVDPVTAYYERQQAATDAAAAGASGGDASFLSRYGPVLIPAVLIVTVIVRARGLSCCVSLVTRRPYFTRQNLLGGAGGGAGGAAGAAPAQSS